MHRLTRIFPTIYFCSSTNTIAPFHRRDIWPNTNKRLKSLRIANTRSPGPGAYGLAGWHKGASRQWNHDYRSSGRVDFGMCYDDRVGCDVMCNDECDVQWFSEVLWWSNRMWCVVVMWCVMMIRSSVACSDFQLCCDDQQMIGWAIIWSCHDTNSISESRCPQEIKTFEVRILLPLFPQPLLLDHFENHLRNISFFFTTLFFSKATPSSLPSHLPPYPPPPALRSLLPIIKGVFDITQVEYKSNLYINVHRFSLWFSRKRRGRRVGEADTFVACKLQMC